MLAVVKTPIGTKVLSYLMAKAVEATPAPNPTQAGIAGAVPAPDTAPLTGGPHAEPGFVPTPGSMAEQAMQAMEAGHSTNGTSYKRL